MDEFKIMERKILAWGTGAFAVLLIIDVFLFAYLIAISDRMSKVNPEKIAQSHVRLDSLIAVHDLKVEAGIAEIKAEIREMRDAK